MSHIKCPTCGSREHFTGYGVAFGGIGGYIVCECGELLEFSPDEQAERLPPDDRESS